ncbi:2348_t:CDS:2 [Cetraspora pellucida]|uniref:2348_t:CDS:1 n=1 Tax=Cetraspora pellucida TaxID=1433469 RepID=A0ACA9KXH5_9GLOM|nr:2348_t:CDS:2 [Cetraspora pellucida]
MIITDIIVRYKKSQGCQIYFQTGSDDHELGITEHIFYRTSTSTHKKKVQKIFTELLNKGDIYLGEYQGRYCVACEDYVSDSKVISDNRCPTPNCQSELRKIKEPAYFLRVSNYYQQLIEYYQKNPDFLLPPNIKKELFENFLKNEGRDLCITRGKIEPGETPETAAKREILEETNLTITDLEEIELDSQKPDRGAEYVLEKLTGAKKNKNSWEINTGSWLNIRPVWSKRKQKQRQPKINFLQDGICSEDLLKDFYHDFLVNNLKIRIVASQKESLKRLEEYQKKCNLAVAEFQKKMNQYELTQAFSQIQSLLNESNKLISDLAP